MEESIKLLFQAVKDLGLSTVLVLLFIAIGVAAIVFVARWLAPMIKDQSATHIAFVNSVSSNVAEQKVTHERTCESIGSIEKIQLSILKSQEQITAAMQQLAEADKQNAETLKAIAANQEAILKIVADKFK